MDSHDGGSSHHELSRGSAVQHVRHESVGFCGFHFLGSSVAGAIQYFNQHAIFVLVDVLYPL